MTNKNVIDIINRLMNQETTKLAVTASEAFTAIVHGYYYIRPGKNTAKFLKRINKILEESWKYRPKMYVEKKDGIPFEVWLWGKMAGEALYIARSMFDEEYYHSQIAKMIAFEEYNDHLLERYMYWLNDEELESVFEGILTFKRNFDAFISDKNFFAMMEELEEKCITAIQESQAYVANYDKHMAYINGDTLDFIFAYLSKESIVATICKYIDTDPVLLASMVKTFKYSNAQVATEYTGLAIWLAYGYELEIFNPTPVDMGNIDFSNIDSADSWSVHSHNTENFKMTIKSA